MSVDVELRIRMEQIRKDLTNLGNHTDKEVAGIVRTFGKGWKKTERQANRATREMQRAVEQRMMGIRRVATNTFGGWTEDIADAVEAMGMFGPAGIIAGASLAAIAGGLLAVGGASYAMWELVSGANAAAESLDKYQRVGGLQLQITEDQRRSMEDFDTATTALGLTFTRIRVEMVQDLIPAWSSLATGVLAAGLMAADATPKVLKFFGNVREGIARTVPGMGLLTDATDKMIGAIDAGDTGNTVWDRYLAEAKEVLTELAALNKGIGDIHRPADVKIDFRDEDRDQEKERQALIAQGNELMRRRASIAKADADVRRQIESEDAAGRAAQAASAVKMLAELEAEKEARIATATAAVSSISQIVQASGAGAKATAAAALLETIALQAVAVGRAFAEGGPWAGPALAAVAIGTIGAQIAALAAAGGGGGGGGQSGGGGSSKPSGRSGGSRRRRSGGRSEGATIQMQYEHRGFGKFFADFDRSGGRHREPRQSRKWAGR